MTRPILVITYTHDTERNFVDVDKFLYVGTGNESFTYEIYLLLTWYRNTLISYRYLITFVCYIITREFVFQYINTIVSSNISNVSINNFINLRKFGLYEPIHVERKLISGTNLHDIIHLETTRSSHTDLNMSTIIITIACKKKIVKTRPETRNMYLINSLLRDVLSI